MSKLEEAIKQLEDLKIDRQSFLQNEENHDEIFKKDIEAIETVLQALENSIPRQVVEEKIEELDIQLESYKKLVEVGKETDCEYYDNIANLRTKQVLQELLKEGKG